MKLSKQSLKGTYTAIVTPFVEGGASIDYDSLNNLIEFQLQAGVAGVVVCGSTGEASTLSDEEYREVIGAVRLQVRERAAVIAGIGSNNTARAVEVAKFLEASEVDGILLVAPPYNKPPQSGIVAHFETVKKATKLPIIAYNIPGRTGVTIAPATIALLAKKRIIIGLKDASASMDLFMDCAALVGDEIALMSGEDSLVHPLMACGGTGVISASANIIPKRFVTMTSHALQGQWEASRKEQLAALPVVRAMFIETNPIPVKTALALKGIIKSAAVRLPLVLAEQSTVERIKALLPFE